MKARKMENFPFPSALIYLSFWRKFRVGAGCFMNIPHCIIFRVVFRARRRRRRESFSYEPREIMSFVR